MNKQVQKNSIYLTFVTSYISYSHFWQRDCSLKKENSVIDYSPCHSIAIRPSFIFGTKIILFGWNPRAFWLCIDNRNVKFKDIL